MSATRIIGICSAAIGGLIMAAAGVSPEEAISNLAAWAKAFGVESPPSWLVSTNIDSYAQVFGFVILATSLLVIFTTTRWWKERNVWREETGKSPRYIADRLSGLYGTGHQIWMEGKNYKLNFQSENDYKKWKTRMEEWFRVVQYQIGSLIGKSEAELFRTYEEPRKGYNGFNYKQRDDLEFFSDRLHRLRQLLEVYNNSARNS